MEFFERPLTSKAIGELRYQYGDYLKLTVDIEKKWLVVGGQLHADAEELLLKKGSHQDNIWGGGINLQDGQIDTTAVLNLRPRMNNDNLEILDKDTREKFIEIIKKLFKNHDLK